MRRFLGDIPSRRDDWVTPDEPWSSVLFQFVWYAILAGAVVIVLLGATAR
jgi:hypothetical protein